MPCKCRVGIQAIQLHEDCSERARGRQSSQFACRGN